MLVFQPKAPYGESQERVAPGWRSNETQWRKIVYGDFDPKPRPQMPSRQPSPTPSPSPPRRTDPAHLSPFDRLPTLVSTSAPDPHAAQRELLSRMKFARTPSTTALPASCGASTLSSRSHSRISLSSIPSPPALSTTFSFQSRSSGGRSNDSHDDSGSDSEEEFIQASIKRASFPSVKRGRPDALSRALEEKQREKLKEEYAAAHLAQIERECEETRELRERGIKPQSLQERILLQGPIMGRRAAGMTATPDSHSWSFEDLPSHIPLYPMPGVPKPRIEKRVQRVQDDQTGEAKEVQVDVEVAEPLKRLFLFGGASQSSSAPRRHSALALSP